MISNVSSALTKRSLADRIAKAADRDLVVQPVPAAYKDAAKNVSIKEFTADATLLGKRHDLVLIAVRVGDSR